MPVFFDLCAWERLEADEAGLELASAEATYLQACAAIPPLVSELLRAGDHQRGYSSVVTDEAGRILFDIPFHEVLDRGGRPRHRGPIRSARAAVSGRRVLARPSEASGFEVGDQRRDARTDHADGLVQLLLAHPHAGGELLARLSVPKTEVRSTLASGLSVGHG
ncbi:DUF6894 family protein [Methylobacterium fujisawaense]|uniref:DUF6894 family protein n=1 Tax=Methylobacterium fujisawaense TaxID=107400 RepID=UPI00313C0374